MQCARATINVVKSISQKSLALAWQQAGADLPMPSFEKFEPSARASDPRYMVIWRVSEFGGNVDFVALYQGSFIRQAFGADWHGRHMSDVIPAPLRKPALAAARHCQATARAVYMNYEAERRGGGTINCERLLLPFGSAREGVQQIVASMEPISFDADIDLDDALGDFLATFKIVQTADFAAQTDVAQRTKSERRHARSA